MTKVSNERKNLSRLAGEFLVASRLTQRGFMISLQWGSTVSYDILVFDKRGKVAFLEVKASASYHRRWILQKKYAQPENDTIPLASRFVCCVDLAVPQSEPVVYVFPAAIVASGLRYYFNDKFPKSDSYHLSLDFKPQGHTQDASASTVGDHINSEKFREAYDVMNVDRLLV